MWETWIMDKDETEVRMSDIELIDRRLKKLQALRTSLADSAKWFYGSDDQVKIRLQMIEDLVPQQTDLLVVEGKLLTSLGWQTAHAQKSQG